MPLDKAYQAGYYDAMVGLIRVLLGQALKSNDSLYFAVLTGCLRISKESIFTGLNNMNAAIPQNYWVNTSGNEIVRSFVSRAKSGTRSEIERLIEGGSVLKSLRQELACRDLDAGIETMWSVLFTTGYLTQRGEGEHGQTKLVIPNREVHWIFVEQIREWFQEEAAGDGRRLEAFCRAFENCDVAAIEEGFQSFLKKTISIRDTGVKKEKKENFYHGILLGLFGNMEGWSVSSNAESGEGCSDILIEIEDQEIGIVIELKYAENAGFEEACQRALQQITDKGYDEALIKDGMRTIYRYGIACYKKRCKVVLA